MKINEISNVWVDRINMLKAVWTMMHCSENDMMACKGLKYPEHTSLFFILHNNN